MQLARTIEFFLMYALSLVIAVLALWALIDAVRHAGDRFVAEGKRTKGFWMALTGGSAFIAVLSVLPNAAALGGGFLQLIAACICCVYLADVRPALSGRGGNWYNY